MPGRHDGATHGIPHIHERQRARRIGPHPLHPRALGPQGGEVIADAAALLLAESVEQDKIIGKPNQVEAVRAQMEKRAPVFADKVA